MRTNEKSQTRTTLHSHLLGLSPLDVGSAGWLIPEKFLESNTNWKLMDGITYKYTTSCLCTFCVWLHAVILNLRIHNV